MDRRVVITGLGAVTPCGNSPEELWNSLMAGRHGFELAPWFPDQEPDNLSVVSRVKNFDASEYFDKKELRRNDVIVQYAVYCAMQALKDAGTDLKDIDPYRVGVVIGSGIGGIYTTEEEMANYHNKGNKRVGVFTITKMIGNMAAGEVAIRTGFKGGNFCVTTACASGTQSIGEAFRSIKHGYLDAAIAGGTEHSDIGFCYASFNNMHAVTRSTDVDRASIPFDAERSGFVLGDGCGLLVLEEYEHAKARGAKIYCEVVGGGASADAYHFTAPHPEGKGAMKAMRDAIKDAGIAPEDIDYVNVHGTSTPAGDIPELKAVAGVLGDHVYNVNISSTKSMTGHLLGAAGAVEALACIFALTHGVVPPTINCENRDPEIDEKLNLTLNVAQKRDVKCALSNTFGFGGHNSTVIFRKL